MFSVPYLVRAALVTLAELKLIEDSSRVNSGGNGPATLKTNKQCEKNCSKYAHKTHDLVAVRTFG